MREQWLVTPFETAPVQIIDGDRGKNYPKQNDFMSEGHCLFLNTGNVTQTGFNFTDVQFVSESKDNELRKGKLERGDVVLTTRGTIGNVAYYRDDILFEHIRINSGMVILRCEREKISPLFLYCYLRSSLFIGQTRSMQSGAAQPQLPIRDLNKIKIPIPPIEEQQKISEIISAYDDLIENNRRRIDLLEQSARMLYKEWFVSLRFPGHEHVKVKDGVPLGWDRVSLSTVAEVNRESLRSNFQGDIEYIDIASVSTGTIEETTLYSFEDAPGRARRVVKHGDIIWSCVRPNRKSYSVIWNPAENLIASTGFAVLSPTDVPTSFLLQATTTDDFVGYLSNNARGAAYPAVTGADFEKATILVSTKTLLQQYNDFAEPLLSQIYTLQQHNRKLKQARDLLLPRLMNGEIPV